ncbi:MAG: FAD-dependent oxidoreductase [bacterium]|jgi:NADPH-dependent 2,4-dienoyl-CoA reductase/sulfur reductase-like enzyme/nitrite reductase/ring-hydroxylating ferredoxin subunit|nr:FAD-dependent oxidoreductase [candidate division KSB1 bacterium]MDH7559774.1 FAD-dependent oxidoreductase [bacterium]
MTQQKFRAGRLSHLAEGVPTAAKVGDDEVLLVRVAGTVHACGGKCPHYGAPLAEGFVAGHEVVCPWHNARFDLRNGQLVAPPALDDLPAYQVEIDGEGVYVRRAAPRRPSPRVGKGKTALIVGAGAAGEAAAETLRREGFDGRVLMVTPEEDLPYDRPNLSKEFLAGKAKPEWLPLRSEEFYREQQIEVLTKTRVTAIDPKGRVAHLEPGGKLSFDFCLIATGGMPRQLPVPGTALRGVLTLRSLSDARALAVAVEKASSVLIVGAGFIGLEAASALRSRGLQVDVVAPEPVPLAPVLGDGVGKCLQDLHEDYGVRFHLGRTVQELRGNGAVEEAVLSDGQRLRVDVVLVGIGIVPATDFLAKTGLVEQGAIPVDQRLETKAAGIFAAGDVAAVPDPRSGVRIRVEHWAVALRQGQHAARAMLGRAEAYQEVPFFWTRQHGVGLKYAGYGHGFDKVLYRGDLQARRFLAGYFSGGRLVATATMGMGEEFAATEAILRRGLAVTPEQFRHLGFDLKAVVRS